MSKNPVRSKQKNGFPGRRTAISKAATLKGIAAFWDTHDFSDYEARCPDVTARVQVDIRRVRHYVAIEPDLLRQATRVARKRKMSAERIINQWVREAASRG